MLMKYSLINKMSKFIKNCIGVNKFLANLKYIGNVQSKRY